MAVAADYDAQSDVERELVLRLALATVVPGVLASPAQRYFGVAGFPGRTVDLDAESGKQRRRGADPP
jgi:hypothetical protein